MTPLKPPEKDERLHALLSCDLFRELDAAALAEVDASVEWLGLEADAPLFFEGDPADALYVVVAGRLEAWSAGEGTETLLGRIYPGEPVGEMALLGDRPRTATVRALRDAVLVRLGRDALERIAVKNPSVLFTLSRALVDRATAKPAPKLDHPVIALVAASADAPTAELADALVKELTAFGPAHRVDAQSLDAAVGPGAARAAIGEPAHARGAAWLAALEEHRGHVVLVADPEVTKWTERCIRHADVIVLVANARARPEPRRLPERLRMAPTGRFDHRELVLVHADHTTRASGAAEWLRVLPVHGSHHVRLRVSDDIARLARLLTGRGVALALSGGGARGYAHLGVLRALREAGVPVDVVCGTSIGSIISALYALGNDVEQVTEELRRGFVDRSPLDYGVPVLSLARGRRFQAMLERLFGDRLAEDTWRRWFCVSSSLMRQKAIVHRSGSMLHGVRASCALPGILPPVVVDGDLLVDGVFLDNLPAARAAAEYGGTTIAVNVLPPAGAREWAPITSGAGLWEYAARMLDPRSPSIPPILQLALQGIFLSTMQESEQLRDTTDLFIEPAVGHVWFLDFANFEPVIQAGYEAACRAIAEWQGRGKAGATRIGAPDD